MVLIIKFVQEYPDKMIWHGKIYINKPSKQISNHLKESRKLCSVCLKTKAEGQKIIIIKKRKLKNNSNSNSKVIQIKNTYQN